MLHLEVACTGEKSGIKSIKHERYDQEDNNHVPSPPHPTPPRAEIFPKSYGL